ncbi:outer membrane beta-barrel protein [Catenovulum adriaticum]|uniref:Porin family protein n=1 Tax=Catenovulum adriaticum TaxID=2984846 RepID=A0ABY7AIX6_9ALTE|nr:outer membrane beta-barrel protein [Catenovulum sp. TS8]WAJ69188.1 porin family protein [Catenovulum sp. TS8]
MFKKALLAVCIAGASFSSFANWVGGVSYINLSNDEGADISLGGLTGSLGYQFDAQNGFYFTPELRVGTGISDDSVGGVDVEMDSFVALSVRGQYSVNQQVYLFAAPSYANAELTASGGGTSVTEDEWEFGLGGGIGYQMTDAMSAEFMYEQYDDADLMSFGVKFSF